MCNVLISTNDLLTNLTRLKLDPQDTALGRSLLWEGEIGQTAMENHFISSTLRAYSHVAPGSKCDVSITGDKANIKVALPSAGSEKHQVNISDLPVYSLERKEANSNTVEFLETLTSKTQEGLKQELATKLPPRNMGIYLKGLFGVIEIIVDFDFREVDDEVKLLLVVSDDPTGALKYCLIDLPSCVKI